MSIAYAVIPRDMYNGLMASSAAAPPKNLDQYILENSLDKMHKVKKSKKSGVADQMRYTANLKNYMKTKRAVESRPIPVSITQLQKRTVVRDSPSPPLILRNHQEAPEIYMTPGENDTAEPPALFTHEDVDMEGTPKAPEKSPKNKKKKTPAKKTPEKTPSPKRIATRKNAPLKSFDEKTRQEIIKKMLAFVNANEDRLGVKGGKIIKDDSTGKVYANGDVKSAVSRIILQSLNAEHVGPTVPGLQKFYNILSEQPEFMPILTNQGGSGMKRQKPKKKWDFQVERWPKPRKR